MIGIETKGAARGLTVGSRNVGDFRQVGARVLDPFDANSATACRAPERSRHVVHAYCLKKSRSA